MLLLHMVNNTHQVNALLVLNLLIVFQKFEYTVINCMLT